FGGLRVFDPDSDLNSKKYCTKDFKFVAWAIGLGNPVDARCNIIPATLGTVHKGVEIFGKLIEGETLDELSEELCQSRVLVNCDGYQMLETEGLLMPPFVIDFDFSYASRRFGGLRVFDPDSDLNSKKYCTKDFKFVAWAIGLGNPVDARCNIIPATLGMVHKGVEIFGKLIEGETLDELSEELCQSRVLVNCDGYQVVYSEPEADNGSFRVSICMTSTVGRRMVDYVAAEEKEKEMASELREMKTKYVTAEEKVKEMTSELEKRKRIWSITSGF
ncbi:hypothetical protein LINGRAHAP2_LOCUS8570, partial [Linum grandiflorum]